MGVQSIRHMCDGKLRQRKAMARNVSANRLFVPFLPMLGRSVFLFFSVLVAFLFFLFIFPFSYFSPSHSFTFLPFSLSVCLSPRPIRFRCKFVGRSLGTDGSALTVAALTSGQASRPAGQQASRPVSQSVSQPVGQQASRTAQTLVRGGRNRQGVANCSCAMG